ncbi:MAG: hypothetical protein H6739_20610 [Alphaproteobacteria bacterium]|nr:hypothetical protein [Alphaproteobacteria bacterium]
MRLPAFCLLLALAACKDKPPIDETGADGPVDADGDGFDTEVDCDDSDGSVHPGATEQPYDGVDNDCDPETVDDDLDGDGFVSAEDCDDADGAVNPDAAERCDGVDNDCDGEIDEGDAEDAGTWYADGDADGYGADESAITACEQPSGHVAAGGDCDDADAAYNPAATEDDCTDPNDYNCDGSVGFADADGDGWAACEDCDDADAAISPDATEVCDAVDNDCDGTIDEPDAADAPLWYADTDGDGYGDPVTGQAACESPSGTVADSSDCDDTHDDVYPGAAETCDELDGDCDGTVDEGVQLTYYQDADGDGYGDPASTTLACDVPSGYAEADGDCDDGAAAVNPDATEVCDGVDNDCDGTTDPASSADAATWYADTDSDGYGDASSATVSCTQPAATVSDSTDCDDGDASVFPGADEYCNSVDDDCDGTTDEDDALDAVSWYADGDSDTYGDVNSPTVACTQPSGYVGDDSDCDDSDASLGPCASCLNILDAGRSTGDGVYSFDPCNTGVDSDYYCDMTTDGGGWTLAGWQSASATTYLGTNDRGTVGDASDWSRDLACVGYAEVMVFNRTYGGSFSQSYTPSTWAETGTNLAIGSAGTAFKHGTYGPSNSLIVMGCVDYTYNGGVYPQYACDSDSQRSAKGHLADYAGEYCSGGRLDRTWAWSNGSSCSYRGTAYTWGFAIR